MINKNFQKSILITGGSGYIGSSLAMYLSKRYNVITLDKKDKNIFLDKKIIHHKINLNNSKKLRKLIKRINPFSVIHLSGQSTIDLADKKKESYFLNNYNSTKILVRILKELKISNFVFSSTAAVYDANNKKFTEKSKILSNNAYGLSKIKCEKEIVNKLANSEIRFCILRFFNVAGSLKKYKIGEYHNPETHLIPIIVSSILNRKNIKIYGKSYSTKDGTCLRDYIHLKDILIAIEKAIIFNSKKNFNSEIFNLGSGKCYSVLDILKTCEKIININAKIKFVKKRKYDVPYLQCNIEKSKKFLKWNPKYSSLKKIISDEIWWDKYLLKNNYKRKFIKNEK